jgi:hypothetical protein
MGGPSGARSRDNLWQGGNDAFRQCHEEGQEQRSGAGALALLPLITAPAPDRCSCPLIALAGTGGEFARVFGAAAGTLVRGTAAWGGIGTTALVSHLGR